MGIVWNELMTTGVPELDEQRRSLIAALNNLAEAMSAGKGRDEIGKILAFTGEYAQKHFRAEERYFEKYHCPANAENKREHQRFVNRFTELMSVFQRTGADFKFINSVYKELSDWLLHHILGIDITLRPYVQKSA